MLETLDHTIRIGSTPTFLYFDMYVCIHVSIHPSMICLCNMASYSSSEPLSVVLSEVVENTSLKEKQTSIFPLLIETVNHRTKIKWQGDVTSLQLFVVNILNLEGSWSFTSNNGGFHVFKSESSTICFYPGTKTRKGSKKAQNKKW